MNNENNIQNQNNNSVNNNVQPTLEMFDFGDANNNLFEAPSTPVQENIQNVANPTSTPQSTIMTQTPFMNENTNQVDEIFEVPSAPQPENQINQTNDIQNVQQIDNTNQVNEIFEVPSAPVQEEIVLEEQQSIPSKPQMEEFAPAQEVLMPAMQTEQIVLDNEKKKQSSDFVIIVIVLIMIVGVFYIDNIIEFVKNNISQTTPSIEIDANSDNLYEGYIKMNEEKSGITLDKLVRFYNFTTNNENYTITLNYKTLKDVKNITEKGYYIEFYDVEKKVLYKELLTKSDKHTQDSTYMYKITLDSNVYEDVTYALVKKYDKNELNKETSLNCIYKVSNQGYNELYKHNFKFKNDMLASYDVNKYIELIDVNNASAKKAKLAIQDEYDKLNNLQLPATYENDKLVYSINLEEVTTSYIPLYKKGTTSRVIEEREEYLKWECE